MSRLLVLFCLCLIPFDASAYFQLDLMKSKRSQKESSQWTVLDWLTQKNKMALMDHWLVMNRSQDWFELNASGSHGRFKLKTTDSAGTVSVNREAQSYGLDLYVSIFNLFAEYELTDDERESYGGGAGLRLLGTSSQSTNLVVRYGWLKRHKLRTHEIWKNQFAEGQLQIYLIKKFGVHGKYRHYFPGDSNLRTRLEGHRATAGAFLEFLIFRAYADFYQEPMERTTAGVTTKEERQGYEAGVKLFF